MAGKKMPPFVATTYEILNSRAYADLPASATKALPVFLGKVKLPWNDPERNLREFNFTYPEAKRYGLAGGTFARAIDDLINFGFIVMAEHGGLRGYRRSATKFKLSNEWRKYGTAGGPPGRGPSKTPGTHPGMARYRRPSKYGTEDEAEKPPTTP